MRNLSGRLGGFLQGERIIVAIFLVLAIWYGYETFGFQTIMMEDVVGPATFPRVIALMSIVLCGIYFYQNRTSTETDGRTEKSTLFGEIVDLIPVILTLFYVLLLEPLGFIVATFGFIALSMRYLDRSWKQSAFYGVFLTLLFFIIFYYGLKAEIPMGRWIPTEELFPFIVHLRDLIGG